MCAERKAQTANQGCQRTGGLRRGRGRGGGGGDEQSLLGGRNYPPAPSQLSAERGCILTPPSSSQGNRRQFELSSSVPPGSLAAAASSLGLGREPRLAYRTWKSLSARVLPSAGICAEPIFLILRRTFREGAVRGTWLRCGTTWSGHRRPEWEGYCLGSCRGPDLCRVLFQQFPR